MTEAVDMQAIVHRLAIGHSLLIEDLDQYPVWWSTVGPVDRTRMRSVLPGRSRAGGLIAGPVGHRVSLKH